jgi:hypothetical protein
MSHLSDPNANRTAVGIHDRSKGYGRPTKPKGNRHLEGGLSMRMGSFAPHGNILRIFGYWHLHTAPT